MIFVDSNIPMYLVGSDHPLKDETVRLLTECVSREEPMVSDVEVLQEILHRYSFTRQIERVQHAFDTLDYLTDAIFPIVGPDLISAKDIVFGNQGVSARDALHVAVMRAHGVNRILSFDRGFERFPDIVRVG